ncbi:MAG TPA: hypothetical protein VEA59_05405 [Patescibacteria group bacterium]|nr:hypothetical protein [Patescibacteria group bacterium]
MQYLFKQSLYSSPSLFFESPVVHIYEPESILRGVYQRLFTRHDFAPRVTNSFTDFVAGAKNSHLSIFSLWNPDTFNALVVHKHMLPLAKLIVVFDGSELATQALMEHGLSRHFCRSSRPIDLVLLAKQIIN